MFSEDAENEGQTLPTFSGPNIAPWARGERAPFHTTPPLEKGP
jgi:hypothetical protein